MAVAINTYTTVYNYSNIILYYTPILKVEKMFHTVININNILLE